MGTPHDANINDKIFFKRKLAPQIGLTVRSNWMWYQLLNLEGVL